jgi:hypothetical protein
MKIQAKYFFLAMLVSFLLGFLATQGMTAADTKARKRKPKRRAID